MMGLYNITDTTCKHLVIETTIMKTVHYHRLFSAFVGRFYLYRTLSLYPTKTGQILQKKSYNTFKNNALQRNEIDIFNSWGTYRRFDA